MTRTMPSLTHNLDDETARLFSAVLRFAEASSGSGQTVFQIPDEKEKFLRSVFTEIDETMLPRQITLSPDAGDTVHLHVSNRRLAALDIDGKPQSGAEGMSTEPSSLTNFYLDKLTELTEACGEISMEVSGPSTAAQSANRSCSAGALARAAEIEDLGLQVNPTLDRFLADVKGLSTAWVHKNDCLGGQESDGPEDLTDQLKEICREAVRKNIANSSEPHFGSRLPVCMLLPRNDDSLVVIVASQEMTFLALAPLSERQEICSSWHAIAHALGPNWAS